MTAHGPQVPDGMRVWYVHQRHTDYLEGAAVPSISPRGGTTIAKLYRAGDDPRMFAPVVEGVAECSDSDNYNKRIGRDIALGRALKALLGLVGR